MVGGSRIRQIGWALVLAVCFALLLALTFKVNAVKSDVRLAERQIIAARDRCARAGAGGAQPARSRKRRPAGRMDHG